MAKKADPDPDEEQQAAEYESIPSSVIFKGIRREGEYELCRGFSALWWSGVSAGLAIKPVVAL
jgi:formate-nitrite transporter family protein